MRGADKDLPTQKQMEREFMVGFNNGMLHIFGNTLYDDNIRKANEAMQQAAPLVKEYWRGYLEGVAMLKEAQTPEDQNP